MNGNLMVFMVTQERMGSPEAVVIYFASTRYHLFKSLPINASPSKQSFVSLSNGKERCVDKGAASETNSLRGQPIMVSSRKVPPYIGKRCETEQGTATKRCMKRRLTCLHN